MSMNNDYWTKQVSDQNIREWHAWAEQERLAKIARGGRRTWWQRLAARSGARQTERAGGQIRRLRQGPVAR